MQFRVGAIVFFTMIVGTVLATLNGPLAIGWLPWGHAKYQVGIEVREAPGVDTHTPVRKNGILIGRVKSIEDQDAGVILRAEIYGNRPLYAEYEPHIRTTVLGDATIDFVSRTPAPGSQPVADGAIFKGRVDPNPFDSLAQLGDLKEEFGAASRSLAQAGDEVAKLAKRVNDAFGDESAQGQGRVGRLLDTTERAMNQFAQTMTSVNEIIGDVPGGIPPGGVGQPPFNAQPPLNGQRQPAGQPPADGQQMRQRLRQGINELPDAIHEFRATLGDSRVVLKSAEKNFKNLEGFTEALGQKGDVFAESLLKVVDGLDKLVDDFSTLTRAINSREGTIGKLVYDPQLYNNLNTLMSNTNIVLDKIYKIAIWLEPVVKDARIFMDKVAREPGRVLSGAINPSITK